MSLYQSPTERGVIKTVAICDRCKMRFNLVSLRKDGDSPGLLVCEDCCDTEDPYRFPARQTESVYVKNTRPEQSLVFNDNVPVVIPTTSRPSLVMDFLNDFYSFEVD